MPTSPVRSEIHSGPPPGPDVDALAIWAEVLEDVAGKINAPSLGVWFEGTIPVYASRERLAIHVPNRFAKEYIETRFKAILEVALRNHLSPASTLEIVTGSEDIMHSTVLRHDTAESGRSDA